MKIVPNKLCLLLVFLLGVFCAIAGNPPPPLTGKKKPPPPPGLPIDENILIVVVIALLFGIYVIYNHRLTTKNPI